MDSVIILLLAFLSPNVTVQEDVLVSNLVCRI